jgi:hypothetical protein
MSENSASFTRDVIDNTNKELTATETMARVNAASQLVGAMLNMAYTYHVHQCKEIARRFCLDVQNDANPDRDIVKFQQRCLRDGVPPQALSSESWIVDVERVVGAGNKTLELAQTSELANMAREGQLGPEESRLAYHLRVEALVDDPFLAERLAPLSGAQRPTDAMQVACSAWATLMDAKPFVVAQGINEIDYVETLLHDLNMEIDMIEKTGAAPEQRRILGLANVIQNITQHVAIIAQNDKEGPRVKQYGDQLKNASNFVRGYAQRAQEQAQANGQQMDPALQAKIQAMIIEAQTKSDISAELAAGKEARKEAAFVRDQARRDKKTTAEISTKDLTTSADIIRDTTAAQHGLHRENLTAAHDINRENAVATADVARENAVAAAQPPAEQTPTAQP